MDKRGSGNVRAPIKRKSDDEKPIGLFCKELYETGGESCRFHYGGFLHACANQDMSGEETV